MKVEVVGIKDLEKAIEKVGQVPIKHARAAAIKGMGKPLSNTRKNAPKDTGALRRGIKIKGEFSRRVRYGKKIFSVIFDPKMNEIFQTRVPAKDKKGKIVGYYPVSQEHGWESQGGRIPGKFFMHGAYDEQQDTVLKTITNELMKRLEGEINKGGMKP